MWEVEIVEGCMALPLLFTHSAYCPLGKGLAVCNGLDKFFTGYACLHVALGGRPSPDEIRMLNRFL